MSSRGTERSGVGTDSAGEADRGRSQAAETARVGGEVAAERGGESSARESRRGQAVASAEADLNLWLRRLQLLELRRIEWGRRAKLDPKSKCKTFNARSYF